jgi:hypothetical protein
VAELVAVVVAVRKTGSGTFKCFGESGFEFDLDEEG